MLKSLTEYDVVYISYDEPNREENWNRVRSIAPRAHWVHGVKGFDAAHKTAAEICSTDRIITVDGDNELHELLRRTVVDETVVGPDTVVSWSSVNRINGLVYGNGGVKLWPRHVIRNMRSHENAERESFKLDFCWDLDYLQRNQVMSETVNNQSALQAFRAGFREGVKMSLVDGRPVEDKSSLLRTIWHQNVRRLQIWMSVGTDQLNGDWAVYGARLGFWTSNFEDLDHALINDYDFFRDLFCSVSHLARTPGALTAEIDRLGVMINDHTDLKIVRLDEQQSMFFRRVMINDPRVANERPITRDAS